MWSQKGSMVRWARWNGCRQRLPLLPVSGNPPKQLQCVQLSTTSLQCFTSLILSMSSMIVPLFFFCNTFSLSVSISTTAQKIFCISVSISLSLSACNAPREYCLSLSLCLLLFRRECGRTSFPLSLSLLSFARSPFLSLIHFSLSISKETNAAHVTVHLLKLFVIKILKVCCHVKFVKILLKHFVQIYFRLSRIKFSTKQYFTWHFKSFNFLPSISLSLFSISFIFKPKMKIKKKNEKNTNCAKFPIGQ